MNIKSGTYQGYLWASDKSEPKVYYNEFISGLSFNNNDNPFIIEGQLINIDDNISYSIKYVDGEYIFKEYDINQLNKIRTSYIDKEYLSNKMGEHKMGIRHYWEGNKDQYCENYEVLQPAENVFIGLKK